ncbi:MAG: cation:proton antiporter [Burkholderiaceae bacterium]
MTPNLSSLGLFPDFPVPINLLTAAGLILIAGILGARLLGRLLPVPTITGYVVTGFLIGPGGLKLISDPMLDDFVLLLDLALGLILFELGRRVDFRWMLREKRLLATGVALSVATFLVLFWLLLYFDVGIVVATMIASIGMAASPAATMNVVGEQRAEGQMTDRLLHIVVIGNVMGFIGFSMGLAALHVQYRMGWQGYVLHPLYLLFGSVLLGWLASQLLVFLGHRLGRDRAAQMIVVIALIAATVGLASMLKLAALIALLAFGIASRSNDRRYALVELEFSPFTMLAYVVLFVFAGARLELSHLRELAPLAIAFVVLRLAVTVATTAATARFNGMSVKKGALLGVALMPLSGFKIILVQNAADAYPQFGADLAALMISMLVILELVGPLCTRYALNRSGESHH